MRFSLCVCVCVLTDGKGYWVAIPAPRTSFTDTVVKIRGIRVLASWLPPRMVPKFKSWGAVALVRD